MLPADLTDGVATQEGDRDAEVLWRGRTHIEGGAVDRNAGRTSVGRHDLWPLLTNPLNRRRRRKQTSSQRSRNSGASPRSTLEWTDIMSVEWSAGTENPSVDLSERLSAALAVALSERCGAEAWCRGTVAATRGRRPKTPSR